MSSTLCTRPSFISIQISCFRKRRYRNSSIVFPYFKIKETKDCVTSPRAWTCDFLLPFYVIELVAVGYRDWPTQSLCVGCKTGAAAHFVIKEVKHQRYTKRRFSNNAETECRDTAVFSRFSGAGQEICGHGRGGPALASSME